MFLKRFCILFLLIMSFCLVIAQDYKNAKLAPSLRAASLLKAMTLEEKIGQMCQFAAPGYFQDNNSSSNIDAFAENPQLKHIIEETRAGHIGSFLHVLSVEEANYLQRQALHSRLKIPLIIGVDAIHGNALHTGCTVYPTNIGMASTFNPELIKRIGVETAAEMRANGMHWTFNPNMDVARDARWGRMGETFGEDPYLVSRMGESLIKGLQGEKGVEPDRVLACAKHLIAGGEPEGGINAAPMDLSEQKLREVYLPPFIAAVDAKVYTVMPAHNELNGIPCHANRWLLQDILRKELSFEGFVVSDWMDVERLHQMHQYASSLDEAYRISVDVGVDMHMQGDNYFDAVLSAVKSGIISESRIDEAVRKILEAKFLLGLFENPLVDEKEARVQSGTKEHQQTALEAARQSIVMLKNEGLLPLKKSDYKRIFIVGPNADSQTILGDWSMPQPAENVSTIVSALKEYLPDVKLDTMCFGGKILSVNAQGIAKASQLANLAELNIVVLGENSQRYEEFGRTCGENCDRDSLSFPGMQQQLLEAVWASGKPTILILLNGRPLCINWAKEHLPAILEAWEPGQEGGRAVTEILFGAANPCGKLPVTIPYNVGQVPTVYNHKASQYSRKFALGYTGCLYPFGYGLSYTTFLYSEPSISKEEMNSDETCEVSVSVTNTGSVDGTEIVQLYIQDEYASVTRPVKELKGFQRVNLKAGETKLVKFVLSSEQLKFFTVNKKWEVESGSFKIMVGSSSADEDLKSVKLFIK